MIGKPKRLNLTRSRGLSLETLETRQLLSANPVISEFLARNDGGLRDGDGRSSDWVEVYNAGDEPVDLAGYRLTDDADERTKWTFPSAVLDPGEYLVVFASGQNTNDYVDPDGNLHTNFTLRRSGEYLALISPTSTTISEFGTTADDYPEQIINVSYGMAQTSDLITRESVVEYAVPMDAAIDGVWMTPDFDAAGHGFTPGMAALGFEERASSRNSFAELFDTELPTRTHAVYARYEFNLEDASSVSGLQFEIFYDDGFIAYLNGQRVLAENGAATPSLFTTASSERPDRDALESQRYDLSQSASLLVDGTNVLAIHGLNHLSDRENLLLAPTLQAVTGGVRLADGSDARTGFLTTPTPRAPNIGNSQVFEAVVLDTTFSHDRGFYDEPFLVEVAAETPEAQIRYTLDGSTPTASHGNLYAGPIEVTTTTTLRAAAFKPGWLPTNVDTQTYIFLDDVLKQPDDPAGFPSTWGSAGAADYEMDPRITTDATSPYYSLRVREALLTFPTMSIVTDNDNLFDRRTGIYSNPQSQGVEWERPASMEFFDPDSGREIQVNAGLRIQGGASRNPNRPKHNLRFLFKGDYGPTKLQFPLFEETTVDEFDTFILRGQNGDSWFHPDVNNRDPQYIRDQWLRDVQRAMGRPTPAQDHVHLYINGLYWGLYHTIEKPNASFFAEHFGGEKEEYDVIQHQGGTVDGNRDAWNEVMKIARAGLTSDAAVEAVGQYVDLEGMIDYLLVNFYAGNTDWDQNNWFGGRRRSPEGRFIFFTWDAERTFLNVNDSSVTAKNVSNQPTELHTHLRANAEYRLQFADQIHRHFFNDGLLTPEQVEARWMRWADEIELALWAEAARFGDAKRSQPYTPDRQWIEDLNKFREDYFPRRTDIVVGQLKRQGLYPDVTAPSFSQHGGMITEGFELTISAPEGSTLYTTDGSDPRLAGGDAAPNAIFYSGAVPIADGTTVKSRVVKDGEWSALNEATFRVASPLPLRITELNFNPYSDSLVAGQEPVDSDRYEFIELANVGTEAIDLAGVQLEQHELNGRPQGIRFQFASQPLQPSERVIVVRDREAFTARYGTSHRMAAGADGEDGEPGQYGGNLENSGEQVTLVDAAGRIIQQFQYGFSGDWPTRADGRGSSLEVIDPWDDPADPANWQASTNFGGSPGTVGTAGSSRVRLNELLADPIEPEGSDLVELRNLTGTDVDVGGWYLSDTEADYLRFRIPDSTVIPASGYVTLDGPSLGLKLEGNAGGVLHLVEADASGRPLHFADLAAFGPSFPGTSLGPSSSDSSKWIMLNDATFGEENSGPFVSEVFISEIQINPNDPDGEGRGNDAEDFQFIELTNRTDQPQDISDWQLDGDITFSFPDSTVLEPWESITVMPFRSTDTGRIGIFRFTSGIPATARIFGRFRGELPKDEGKVQLIRPLQPGVTNSAEIVAEEVVYQSTPPWPDTSTAGDSLHRTSAQALPDSPASWFVGVADPGEFQVVDRVIGDSNGDGAFDQLDIVEVLARGKYMTGQSAGWEDGDWDGNGVFDRLDLVFALQHG